MRTRELAGRVVAITGAAGGLGRELCVAFAARGARIAALDLDDLGLERLRRDLALPEFLVAHGDLTDPQRCAAAFEAIVQRWGGVDVLVNNAGISHRSLFAETEPAVIRRVMEVNFFSALHATHAALPTLLDRQGAVVVISSVAGFAPLAARAGYSASKHALHGMFNTLRAELAPRGLDVLIVCPAFIATEIAAAHLGGDGAAALGPRTVVGNALDPATVARQIVRAVQRRRRMLLVGRVAWLAWIASRLAPGWYARAMVRSMRDELGQPR